MHKKLILIISLISFNHVLALSPVYIDTALTTSTSKYSLGINTFKTIQEGINAVDEGGIVYVKNGIYNENILITKSLSLIGEGILEKVGTSKDAPSLNGGKDTNPAVLTINGENKNIAVTIRNLNISHANNGINVLQNALVTIENNTVHDYYKNGITFGPVRFDGYGGVRGIVVNNIITGNGPTDIVAQNGIQISEGNTASIINNVVSNHFYTTPDSWWGVGILTNQSNNVSIYNNTLINNQTGINIKEGKNNLISSNIIKGTKETEAGILLSEPDNDSYPVRNNTITNNTITGGKKSILAHDARNNTFTLNTFNNKNIFSITSTDSSLNVAQEERREGMVLGVSAYTFLHNLQEGSVGNDVIELQKVLIANQCLDGKITGYFGTQTKHALMCWQSKNNITMTGYFGTISRELLNSKNR